MSVCCSCPPKNYCFIYWVCYKWLYASALNLVLLKIVSHPKIQDEDICSPHDQGLISPARLGEDGRPEAVEHVLHLIEDRGDQAEAE